MGIKNLQADLAGAALLLGQRLHGDHRRTSRERKLARDARPRPAAATTTAASPRRFRGGGHKQRYRVIDFKRDKIGVPADGRRRSSTIRTAPRASRSCTTPTARSATSSRPTASSVGDTDRRRAATPTSSPATACRSATSRSARRSTTSSCKKGKGGAARALGRRRRAAHGQGRRLRAGPAAERRDPQDPPRLPRHHRPGLEHRAREHQPRQGRPHALARPAPAQPRRHDEPRRSPDGRRRRSHLRRPSPVLAVGPARQGPQDAQQQAHRRDDRQAPQGEGLSHASQHQERAVRRRPPA